MIGRFCLLAALALCGCGEDLRLGRVEGAVPGSGARTLSLQVAHSCGVRTDGGVFCFGSNLYNQLGFEGFGNDELPRDISMPDGLAAVEIVTGRTFSCARLADGSVACWGGNEFGELGRGVTDTPNENRAERASPRRLANVPPARRLFAGAHGACLTDDMDAVYCWGRNHTGQVAPDVPDAVITTPRRVPGIQALDVALAEDHTCVRTPENRARCWGSNDTGQLGDGTTNDSREPREPLDLGPIRRIVAIDVSRDAARGTTCALREDASVRCWGFDDVGQIGDGLVPADHTIPASVIGLPAADELVAGQRGVIAHTSSGWYAWGADSTGALGRDAAAPPDNVYAPEPAPRFDEFDAVGLGFHHGCGVRRGENRVTCWGSSFFGSLPSVPMGERVDGTIQYALP